MGNPQDRYAIVHIGGTNGKGSVATLVYETLRGAGFRVGLYTSPHLVDATERVVVNGKPISKDAFAAWTNALHSEIEATGASHFEAITAIAFADFAARHVDIAVVEVGLGGRLDSTNVVDPVVTAVTNVGNDHEEFLGTDLERVAWEKASIAKTGIPFVIGEENQTLCHALLQRAEGLGGVPCTVQRGVRYEGAMALAGAHQRRNAAVAAEVLNVLPAVFEVSAGDVARGFARASVPGRFDWRGKWILDVAHNEASMGALTALIRDSGPPRPIHVVFGALNDKPVAALLKSVAAVADRIWVTVPPSAPSERAVQPHQLAGAVSEDILVEPRFDRALRDAEVGAGTVVVTGSFYTVGDAMARLPGFVPFG